MNYPHTFNLKNPKSKDATLIYLRASIKGEGKYLKYSTGEKIKPSQWDFENQFPIRIKGRTAEAVHVNSVIKQLTRYSEAFQLACNKIIAMGDTLSVDLIKDELDFEFKKERSKGGSFFSIYDQFIAEKKSIGQISNATIIKYENMKAILKKFSEQETFKLTFTRMNDDFYIEFVKFCRTKLEHKDNTLGRNIGFLKTFLNWAIKRGYHHNYAFKDFHKPSQDTDEIALSFKELNHLWNFQFKTKRLEKVRDVFVFGCATGMRYSDYSKISKKNIRDGQIFINTQKQKTNLGIPLNQYSKAVLEKYDYKLPLISPQKFRRYLKEACGEAGFKDPVYKTSFIGSKRTETKYEKYEIISSHTARRTFITLSLEKGMRPDIVMSITGHKSYSSFKKYIKLSKSIREEEMAKAWN